MWGDSFFVDWIYTLIWNGKYNLVPDNENRMYKVQGNEEYSIVECSLFFAMKMSNVRCLWIYIIIM